MPSSMTSCGISGGNRGGAVRRGLSVAAGLRAPAALAAALLLAACGGGRVPVPLPDLSVDLAEGVIRGGTGAAPAGTDADSCWGRDVRPARVETVTEHFLVSPAGSAPDGTVTPAVYRTETRQSILEDREPLLFPAPCPEVMDQTFVASLQRALQVRGLYSGPATGIPDRATRRAIRTFQRPQGLDSSVLSMAAAQQLGLVRYDPEDF